MGAINKPPFAQLLDWLEGKLPEGEKQVTAQQVETADAATQADVAWIRRFLEATQTVQLAEPPPHVRQGLARQFAAYADSRKQPGFFQRLIATLTFDSRSQPGLVGVRSAATEGQQRQFIYTTNLAEVALNIQPQNSGSKINMTGQLFPATEMDPAGLIIQLVQNTAEVGMTITDDLGEFYFFNLPAGAYELIVSAGNFEIMMPVLL